MHNTLIALHYCCLHFKQKHFTKKKGIKWFFKSLQVGYSKKYLLFKNEVGFMYFCLIHEVASFQWDKNALLPETLQKRKRS